MAIIAADLGGTKLSLALFEEDATITSFKKLALAGRSGREVGRLIIGEVNKLIGEAAKNNNEVEALGICVPGIAYAKTGRVWAPNITGWDDYPLLEELKNGLAKAGMTIRIDSDRACYILGEVWKGSAVGCKDVIFLSVGTGIGAGILVNGEILRGSNDIAGAIGWMALNRPFADKYKTCGCFEYHASGEGFGRVASDLLGEQRFATTLGNKHGGITAKDVFDADASGDEMAVAVIQQAIGYWGMAVANLVSLFNPEKIIFGGGVFGPAIKYLDAIFEEARKWAQPISINQVKLEASALGGDAGLYGAGYLALKK